MQAFLIPIINHCNSFLKATKGIKTVDWLLGTLSLLAWVILVVSNTQQPLIMLRFLIAEFFLILGVLLIIADASQRKILCLLFLGGLAWFTFAILEVRSFPQATAEAPDASTYHLYATAITTHWNGEVVRREDFPLPWLDQHGRDWFPEENLPLGYVMGTRNYLYQAYAAVIYYFTGIHRIHVYLSQAILLAAIPPFVFGIAQLLFRERRVALLAVCLVFVDANFPVVGAFLLKESLLCLIILVVLWLTILVFRGAFQWYIPVLLVMAIAGLSVLRFHGNVAWWLAMFLVLGIAKNCCGKLRWYIAGLVLASYVAAAVVFLPPWTWGKHFQFSIGLTDVASTNLVALYGGVGTLVKAWIGETVENEPSISSFKNIAREPWTADWFQLVKDDPFKALIRSIVRTVFAPYPWIWFKDGLLGNNWYELMYPGVIPWCFGFPFGIVALWKLRIKISPMLFFIFIWIGVTVAFYLVFQGEFSTRARVHLMPVFWIFIAYGLVTVYRRLKGEVVPDKSIKKVLEA